MRRSRWCPSVSLLLAVALGFCLPGPSSLAFDPDEGLNAGFTSATSSGDSDNIGKQVMLGVFVAAVLVLFYLGFKADRDFRAEAAPSLKLAGGRGPDVVVDFESLPQDEALVSEPSAQFAGRLGLEFRF